ncbi:hypothetical protein Tco_0984432, partial [Tanacetum coccineum]
MFFPRIFVEENNLEGLLLPLPQILRPEKSETVGGRDDTFDKEILKKRLVGLEHKLIHATINNPTLYGLPDTVNLLKDTRADLVHSAAIIQDKNMLVRSSPNLEKLRVQHDRRLDYITRKYISTASIFNESARRKAQEQDESWFEGSTKDI